MVLHQTQTRTTENSGTKEVHDVDRQKITSSILIAVEAGLLCIVLVVALLSGAKSGEQKPSGDKLNTELTDGTEGVNSTQVDSTENDWFAEEEMVETFSEAVEQKRASMTTEQKVAQLFLVSPETLTGVSPVTVSGNGTRTALEKYPVGGLVYSAMNFMGPEQSEALISGAQGYSQGISGLPLFILVNEDAADYAYHATLQFTEQEGMTFAGNVRTYVSTNPAEAVAAIADGANMIYASENFTEIYEAVLAAVNDGTIPQVRLENAVGRVLSEKLQ